MRPRYFPIGTPVLYTHRGCGVVWHSEEKALVGAFGVDDKTEEIVDPAHWNWSTRDKRFAPPRVLDGQPSRPSRRDPLRPDPKPLDRWVHVWPEDGVGYVVGLTFRSEGWRDSFTQGSYETPWEQYTETYLSEAERFPLYEIRASLRAKPILAPVWSVSIQLEGRDGRQD